MMKMSRSSAQFSNTQGIKEYLKEFSRHCFTTSVFLHYPYPTVKILALRSSSTNFQISLDLLLPLERNFSFVVHGVFSLLISILLQNCFCRRRCVWSFVELW